MHGQLEGVEWMGTWGVELEVGGFAGVGVDGHLESGIIAAGDRRSAT